MSSQAVDHSEHPVVDFAHRLHDRLNTLAEMPLLSMTPEQKRDALVSLTQDVAQLEALRLRLLLEAEQSEATVDSGARSAADWVAIETRQVRRDARSDLKLARAARGARRACRRRWATDAVNVAQARAIVASLDRLPRTGEFAVTAEQRAAAEAHLVELAAHHDAKALRILGRPCVRGDRPRGRRAVRGPGTRGRRSPSAAAYHLHDVGGRRRHLPRPLPHPRPARADADQDDPRHHLTGSRPRGHRPRPAHPGAPRDRVHPAHRVHPGRVAAQDRRLLSHHRRAR